MMRILQINLNCSKDAQKVMLQTAADKKADVIIISEQNKNLPGWYADMEGKAAIALLQNSALDEVGESGRGFTWIRVKGIRIYSCYISPNITMTEYKEYLENLETSIRSGSGEVILAGDFNAKNAEWGSSINDERGDELSALIASLDLSVCNIGTDPTFERGPSSSVIDVTFASKQTASQVRKWNVLNEESRSDHYYVFFVIGNHTEQQYNMPLGWSWRKMNVQKLEEYLNSKNSPTNAEELMEVIKGACDAAMPRRNYSRSHHKPQYWWTNEIAELRKLTLAARRRYQRAIKRGPADEEHRGFKEAKKDLRLTIRRSQETCWKRLCTEVDHDPWGTPYRIVMRKIGKPPPIPTNLIPTIVSELFPMHPRIAMTGRSSRAHAPPITLQELEAARKRLRLGKAPGPDGVPNEVLKAALKTHPQMFGEVFNRCMEHGVFPKPWKRARLVLLRKGDKPADLPSSYRPLCMLDSTGKLFERILCNRIGEFFITSQTGLSDNQYGFREGKSTVDAISRVMREVTDAAAGPIYRRELCVLVTLDVANAFNSASWAIIITALEKKKVPNYLIEVLRDYLTDRVIMYGEDQTIVQLSSGVPQGSVLGPLLWGIMYDGLLSMEMPRGITLVGFADDIAVIGRGRTTEQLEQAMNEALMLVQNWLTESKLQLAVQKTEAVMQTRKRDYRKPTFMIGNHRITTNNSLKYLGVVIDKGRRYKVHEETVGAKAMRTAQALARILPNVGGSSTSKRRLLTTVVHSQILYAAPIWAPVLEYRVDSNTVIKGDVAKHIKAAQRLMALRVTRAYKTTSYEASTLIAAMPPILLLAKERAETHSGKSKQEARKELMRDWQRQWNSAENGRWTYRLIQSVEKWTSRKHGDIDFFLTQILSGHGCFNYYLWRMKKLGSPMCSLCEAECDDAGHTLFVCDAFENWRRQLFGELGLELTPDNLVDTMLEGRNSWEMISSYVSRVMSMKTEEERRRQTAIIVDVNV